LKNLARFTLAAVGIALCLGLSLTNARANNHIFPPATAAQGAIDFDANKMRAL